MNGKKLSVILFAAIVLLLPAVTLALPKQTESETENRKLAKLPTFSLSNYLDRSFMTGFEDYFSDHFFLRDSWVTLKSDTEYAMGKRENNGIYIGKNQLIKKIGQPDYEVVNENLEAIKAFADKTGIKPTVMLVPTPAYVLSEKLPLNVPVWNQQDFIDDVYQSFNGVCESVDVSSALLAHKEEYIYYRTDHHWTTLGAYYGYQAYCEKTGLAAYPLEDFTVEHVSDDFNGTLYSESGCRFITPDVLDFYTLQNGSKVKSVTVESGTDSSTYNSLYFTEYLSQKDKYSAFLGPNKPFIKIITDNPSGKKLLVFKDSYAHCLIPFLINYYSEIDVVDLRYVNFYYTDYTGDTRFDDALILYNVETFVDDTNIAKIGR